MKTSLKGLIELAGHEGICTRKYLDSVGVWTIGVGATRSEIPDIASWPTNKELTMKEVFDSFKKSIVKYEDAVNKALKVKINQEQFDALVSVCYNIGVGGLAKSTFMKYINSMKSNSDVAAAIKMWDKPREIMGRRNKEALLYATGKYQNGGKALLFPVSENGNPIYGKGVSINVEEYLK